VSTRTESKTSPRLGFEPLGESLAKKISTKINDASPSAVNADTATMHDGAKDQSQAATGASESAGTKCQACDEEEHAVKFCTVCDQRLCHECAEHHKKDKQTKKHEMTNLDQPTPEEDPDR